MISFSVSLGVSEENRVSSRFGVDDEDSSAGSSL